MKTITIVGKKITDIETFYDEIQRSLCPDFTDFGRNLPALNDVLEGGFGVYEYHEPVELIWDDSSHSREALGYEETETYYKHILEASHSTSRHDVERYIAEAAAKQGLTIFDTIVDLISDHDHIKLTLK